MGDITFGSVRVDPSAFEQMEFLLSLSDLCIARDRLFVLPPCNVRSVRITEKLQHRRR